MATQPASYYSQLEDRVYNLIDGFSKEIPSGFIKMPKENSKDSYCDSSLKIPTGSNAQEDDASGAGRFITKDFKSINAGYLDAEEVKATKRTGDTRHLEKTVGFIKKLNAKSDSFGLMDDFMSFVEGSQGVMYIKMEGVWRRKDLTFKSLGERDIGGLDNIRALPSVSEEKVRRYLDLAERLDNTYFRRSSR